MTGAPDGWKVAAVTWYGAKFAYGGAAFNNVVALWIATAGAPTVAEWVFLNPADQTEGHHAQTRSHYTAAPHTSGTIQNITVSPVSMHQAGGYIAPFKGRIVAMSVNSFTPWAPNVNQGKNLQAIPIFAGVGRHDAVTNYYSLDLTGSLQTEISPVLSGPVPVAGYEELVPFATWPPSPANLSNEGWEVPFNAGELIVAGITPTWAAYTTAPGYTSLPEGYTHVNGIYLNPPMNVSVHVIYDV